MKKFIYIYLLSILASVPAYLDKQNNEVSERLDFQSYSIKSNGDTLRFPINGQIWKKDVDALRNLLITCAEKNQPLKIDTIFDLVPFVISEEDRENYSARSNIMFSSGLALSQHYTETAAYFQDGNLGQLFTRMPQKVEAKYFYNKDTVEFRLTPESKFEIQADTFSTRDYQRSKFQYIDLLSFSPDFFKMGIYDDANPLKRIEVLVDLTKPRKSKLGNSGKQSFKNDDLLKFISLFNDDGCNFSIGIDVDVPNPTNGEEENGEEEKVLGACTICCCGGFRSSDGYTCENFIQNCGDKGAEQGVCGHSKENHMH